MASRRGGLGRGLEALIPGGGEDNLGGAAASVDIDAIEPNPLQPRTRWDEAALQDLTDSIRAHGVIQPIVVTRRDGLHPYQIIAGERRWRAAQRAGLGSVPVVVRESTVAEALQLALIENIQRADLNAIEEGLAYKHLTEEFGLTQAQVAEQVGRSRPSIANTLRLLSAPDNIREAVANEDITPGHAKALLAIPDRTVQSLVLERVIREGLTVRQTERYAQIADRTDTRRPPAKPDPATRSLEDDLSRTYRTKVEVMRGKRGGRIVIHFFSDEELNEIGSRLLVDDDDF